MEESLGLIIALATKERYKDSTGPRARLGICLTHQHDVHELVESTEHTRYLSIGVEGNCKGEAQDDQRKTTNSRRPHNNRALESFLSINFLSSGGWILGMAGK